MWRRRMLSFKYAIAGLRYFFRSQVHARIHLGAALVVVLLGGWLQVDRTEWLLLTLCTGSVLVAEALNTALEELTNLVSPDHHELAGRTKDVAAGAVLLAALIALVVGAGIFLPKLIDRFINVPG